MADTKTTGLTELTSAATTDLVYIVDDPGGTPVGKKITVNNLLNTGTGEVMLSAAGGWPSTTSGCATPAKTEYGTNDVDLYLAAFDASTDEFMQWSVWMPNNWNGGTVTFQAIWTAASGSGDVVWGLQGRAFENDDAIDAAWGTAQTVTDTLTATGDMCVSGTSSAITLAGSPAAGQLVQFRAYRDADAGGDTLAADALLIALKVFYTKA